MHKIADAGYITLHRGSINIRCHFVHFLPLAPFEHDFFKVVTREVGKRLVHAKMSVTKILVYGYSVFISLIP